MLRFDHFGYAAYFIILELLHKDGIGDVLRISPTRLCQKLHSRPTRVRLLLDFCRTSDKVEFGWTPTEVGIKIKKFRERQSNLKSKLISKPFQPSSNLTLEEKREEEKREENVLACKPAVPTPVSKSKLPKPKTELQRIVEAYKHAKGVPMDDTAWDKAQFARASKSGKSLLLCFGGDLEKSAAYLFIRSEELNAKGLDWTFETIVRHAWDGMGIPKEEANGQQHSTVGSTGLPDARGHRRLASAREVASETLRAIESTAIRAEGTPRLEADGGDSAIDHEPFE